MIEVSNYVHSLPFALKNGKAGFKKNDYTGMMERTLSTFDKKGRLKQEFIECENGDINIYKYNKAGNIKKHIIDLKGDQKPDKIFTYKYRGEKLLKEIQDLDADGKPDVIITLQYDQNGAFIGEKISEIKHKK